MANTYRVKTSNIVAGNNKSMISLWNGAGSTDILKVGRIWVSSQAYYTTYTGVLLTLNLTLITAHTVATKLFPIKMKQSSSNLHANVVASTGATVTESVLFRRVLFSGDECTVGEFNLESRQTHDVFTLVWDSGYAGSNTEPITLNASEGIHIKCATNTTVAQISEILIEFTT